MELKLEEVVDHLRMLRETHGEDTFKKAVQGLAKQLVRQGDKATEFLKTVLQQLSLELDLAALQAEVQAQQTTPPSPPGASGPLPEMLKLIQQQMPGIKTQAQFNLVMASFEALQHYLNTALLGDMEKASQLRVGLTQLLDLAPKAGEVQAQLEETPEATSNPDFVQAPKQFTEEATEASLLQELELLSDGGALQRWYESRRPQLNTLVTTEVRNRVFDAIRVKRTSFQN